VSIPRARFFKPVVSTDISHLLQIPDLGGAKADTPTDSLLSIRAVTFKDVIAHLGDFLSLDISVNSTGWVRYVQGELAFGTRKLEALDDLGRRQEFREFLKEITRGYSFDHVLVEDVIGGVNFRTNKILYQLNVIPDDLIADGVIQAKALLREGNSEWKSGLKKVSGYSPSVKGSRDDKKDTIEELRLIGFSDTEPKPREDVCDAMGLAVGTAFNRFIKPKPKKNTKLRTDITKVYRIEQFFNETDAALRAHDLGGYVHTLDFTDRPRDLKYNFRKYIEEQDDDSGIYHIIVPTTRIGSVALQRGFDLSDEITHLVVYLPRSVKKSVRRGSHAGVSESTTASGCSTDGIS